MSHWARSTLLNGAAFDDQTLSTGDRLTIGLIDMNVVSILSRLTQPEKSLQSERRQSGYARTRKLVQRLCKTESVLAERDDQLAHGQQQIRKLNHDLADVWQQFDQSIAK